MNKRRQLTKGGSGIKKNKSEKLVTLLFSIPVAPERGSSEVCQKRGEGGGVSVSLSGPVGEGSRGGRVIGTTKRQKSVFRHERQHRHTDSHTHSTKLIFKTIVAGPLTFSYFEF